MVCCPARTIKHVHHCFSVNLSGEEIVVVTPSQKQGQRVCVESGQMRSPSVPISIIKTAAVYFFCSVVHLLAA